MSLNLDWSTPFISTSKCNFILLEVHIENKVTDDFIEDQQVNTLKKT